MDSKGFAAQCVFCFVLLLSSLAFAQGTAQYCDSVGRSTTHGEQLKAACDFALSLSARLPNFICEERTKRTEKLSWGRTREDIVFATVTHDQNGEHYSNVSVNWQGVDTSMASLPGDYSEGEFSGDLAAVFDPQSKAEFEFVKKTKIDSMPALEYQFKVSRENNRSWSMRLPNRIAFPGFKGTIWLGESTGAVVRLNVESFDVPSDFPMLKISASINYSSVPLGDGSVFVLPVTLTSVSCMNSMHRCSSTLTMVQNCHKFAAKSRILQGEAQ